jgi:hypothetical protein
MHLDLYISTMPNSQTRPFKRVCVIGAGERAAEARRRIRVI